MYTPTPCPPPTPTSPANLMHASCNILLCKRPEGYRYFVSSGHSNYYNIICLHLFMCGGGGMDFPNFMLGTDLL